MTVPAGAELDVPGSRRCSRRTPTSTASTRRSPCRPSTRRRGGSRSTAWSAAGSSSRSTSCVAMGLDEYAVTLTCVSNEVGGDLIGNADVARRARARHAGHGRTRRGRRHGALAQRRRVHGIDAARRAHRPVATRSSRSAMNGEPLPLEHGFPVRMVVPGLYGYVSATKWLSELKVDLRGRPGVLDSPRLQRRGADQALVAHRHAAPGRPVPAAASAIAGVAWAQTVGIERVEVASTTRPWQRAELSTPVNRDTWVQWVLSGMPRRVRTTSRCGPWTSTGRSRSSERARSRPTARPGGSACSSQ